MDEPNSVLSMRAVLDADDGEEEEEGAVEVSRAWERIWGREEDRRARRVACGWRRRVIG